MAPVTGHVGDFERWVRLGVYMQNLGNPYTGLYYYPGVSFAPFPLLGSISYPPLSAFIFALTYRLYLFLGEPSRFVYYFLLKQPLVISDLGIGIVLARLILQTRNRESARTTFLIWTYFPLGILVSSVWGALDPFALFLTLLALYSLTRTRLDSSALFLGLAIFLKTIPVITLPVILMHLGTDFNQKLRYAIITLAIPTVGTFAPTFLLNWGTKGLFDNFSFQVNITTQGAFGVLGSLFQFYEPSLAYRAILGILWIPILVFAYATIYKKNMPLFEGLTLAILAFSVSRVFLPEQWTIYPAAFLLAISKRSSLVHFLGLSITATIFLIFNNNLLVPFLTPISTRFYYWWPGNSFPLYTQTIDAVLLALSSIYLIEAVLTMTERKSLISRVLIKASKDFGFTIPDRIRTFIPQ